MEILISTLKKYKYILGLTVCIVLYYFLSPMLFPDAPPADTLVATSPEHSEVEAVTVDLLTLLLSLKTLEIDTSIFSDDRFKSLTDFSVEVTPQPIGRANPFLPISGVSNSAAPQIVSAPNTRRGR